jgi:tetratricopeptide (TPR) repeat protein
MWLLGAVIYAVFTSGHQEVSYWYLAAARNALQHNNPATAQRCSQVARRWFDSPMAWLVEAEALAAEGKPAEALAAVTAGLERSPDDRFLRATRSWLHVQQGNAAAALQELAPPDSERLADVVARADLGETLLTAGKLPEAISALQPISLREPPPVSPPAPDLRELIRMITAMFGDDPQHKQNLARWRAQRLFCEALRSSGQYDDLLAAAERGEADDPSLFYAEILEALVLLKQDDALLEKLHTQELSTMQAEGELNIETLNAGAYFRALADRELGTAERFARAAVRRSAALRGGDEDPGLLDTLGFVLYQRGRYRDALTVMEQCLAGLKEQEQVETRILRTSVVTLPAFQLAWLRQRERRNAAVLHYHRALVHFALENPAAAEADLRRVSELGFTPGRTLF